MALKKKRTGTSLSMRSFVGRDDVTYLVFKTSRGGYHVFSEVEAKEAARQCGGGSSGTTRQMWDKIWNRG